MAFFYEQQFKLVTWKTRGIWNVFYELLQQLSDESIRHHETENQFVVNKFIQWLIPESIQEVFYSKAQI